MTPFIALKIEKLYNENFLFPHISSLLKNERSMYKRNLGLNKNELFMNFKMNSQLETKFSDILIEIEDETFSCN